jgi:hypothetical protein
MKIATRLATLFGLTTLFAVASADAPALPFQPPANWQALPTAFIPHPIVSWQKGLSSFTLMSTAFAIPPEKLEPLIKGQAAFIGSVASEASTPVCGLPAAQLVINMTGASQTMTEQVLSTDGVTYIFAYARPTDTPADASIATTMSGFCGEKSVASLAPPTDWTSSNAQLLGLWIGATPTEQVTLMSSTPQTDAQQLARDVARTAFKGAQLAIVSNTTGLLCGLPARFFSAKVTPNGLPPSLVTMETTQSPTKAYILIYAHPTTSSDDPAALASLKTLCANPS